MADQFKSFTPVAVTSASVWTLAFDLSGGGGFLPQGWFLFSRSPKTVPVLFSFDNGTTVAGTIYPGDPELSKRAIPTASSNKIYLKLAATNNSNPVVTPVVGCEALLDG